MVGDEPASSSATLTALPHLVLHSMNQSELKELIHQLVSRVTGRTSPLFGSLGEKPDWWPGNLEWTSPEELADKYQNPCEKLREIVRSCYCYMDQDNLIDSSELTELTSELPVSPAVGDTDTCETDPDTEQSTDAQVRKVGTTETDQVFEELKETDSKMTIHSDSLPSGGAENTIIITEVIEKEPGKESMPSGDSVVKDIMYKVTRDSKNENAGNGTSENVDIIIELDGNVETDAVAVGDSKEDCVATGTSETSAPLKTNEISPDVIAQIDFEIAKSLKKAFSNMNTLGLSNSNQDGLMNKGAANSTDLMRYFERRPKEKIRKRRRSAEDIGWKTESYDTSQGARNSNVLKLGGLEKVEGFEKDQQKPIRETVYNVRETKTEEEELPDIVKEENKEEKQEDEVVWICFICAKGFPDQSELMKHQDVCEEETIPESIEVSPIDPIHTECPPLSLNINQSEAVVPAPVPKLLRKVGSSLKSLPLGLPCRSKFVRKRRKIEDIYIPPSRDVYFESLGLFPTPQVEEISKSPRKSVTDDDCQIIDLTVEEAHVPMTPRTRSIMSQLSRDDNFGRKRQLSFSVNGSPTVSNKENLDMKELSNSDSSEEEEVVPKERVPSKSAVLGFPLSSPLGQRLKKHWKFESKVPIIENIETFCKTDRSSIVNLVVNDKKNPMVEKLRNRPPPQCTFRFTKKYFNQWCHWYKFNKADRHEFNKRLKFGLDRESRLRLKRMKRCKVVLARISKRDIKYWTTARTKVVPKRYLPTTSMIQQNRYFQMNRMANRMASPTQLRPMHSALVNQLLHRPPNFRMPTPQLLVRTVPMGVQGMRLQVLPVQQNQNIFLNQPVRQVRPPPLEIPRSQKRKQVFTNVRADDDIVICLSSDEEEEVIVQRPSRVNKAMCTMCSLDKDSCRIHGRQRMGPASFKRRMSSNSDLSTSPKINTNPCSPGTSVIKQNPHNTVQTVQIGNTASARVFGSSFRPAVPPPPLQRHNVAEATHVRVQENCVTLVPALTGAPLTNTSQTVQFKSETGSVDQEKAQNQTGDGEYMDYEVICIDSDNELE